MVKRTSIQLKIVLLILILMIVILSTVIFITIRNQKNDLLTAKKTTLSLNTDLLSAVIKSIMLSGEAPVAVRTMSAVKEIPEFQDIEIFRTDGDVAFNDYKTLDFVNSYQNDKTFERTSRIEKKMIMDPNFQYVLENNMPHNVELVETKEIEYFYPIRNEMECWKCHGEASESGAIRGIAHFKVSIADIYKQINKARFILLLLLVGSGLILAFFMILSIHKIIILPILSIGNTVKKFGEGNLDLKVKVNNNDELGDLANKINDMFIGIKERFNLSKYVSKSTDEMIKKGEIASTGENKKITVLFSDIRGFTSYSEKNRPEIVVENLNRILQVQADIVEKYNGDIDKFVGDELMAVFSDEVSAIKCAYEMIVAVKKVNNEYNAGLFVGIGINTGFVIAGNIGSKNRLEYAVIGDTVNLASRLCNIAKKNMLLISESTYEKGKSCVKAQLISGQKIKGKTHDVSFYAVLKILK